MTTELPTSEMIAAGATALGEHRFSDDLADIVFDVYEAMASAAPVDIYLAPEIGPRILDPR